jgi:transcription antitermination factor NusG
MVQVQTSGVIVDWPLGFSAQLQAPDWLVVHTYPRQEKVIIEKLRTLAIPGVALFERRLRHYPGKGTQESIVPLLPGYLFVAAERTKNDAIYNTNRVVRIIEAKNPQELCNDLRALITLITAAPAPVVVRPELIPGKKITITHGIFAGASGIIKKRKQETELIVNLHLLGTSVAVNLPAMYAELAEVE